MREPLADDQRPAGVVPSAGDLHPVGFQRPEGSLTFGRNFLLFRPYDVRSVRLVDGHDHGEPGGQRHRDHRHAAKRGAPIRSRGENRGSEHDGNAQGARKRRGAGRVEVNAHAQDQRQRVVGDVVGASLGGFLPRIVQQEPHRQRRRHNQLERQVDHARADAGDAAEQDVVRESGLGVGEHDPNAPQRVADVDDGEAEQHGDRRGENNHRSHHIGAALGVHGNPRCGQDGAPHGDLSNEGHGEGVGEDRHRAGPNEHRGGHREHSQDRARQDEAASRGRRNQHIQPGQEHQHGAQHDVGPAERQRRGREPEAGHDGEQQGAVRPSAYARQLGGVGKPADRRRCFCVSRVSRILRLVCCQEHSGCPVARLRWRLVDTISVCADCDNLGARLYSPAHDEQALWRPRMSRVSPPARAPQGAR